MPSSTCTTQIATLHTRKNVATVMSAAASAELVPSPLELNAKLSNVLSLGSVAASRRVVEQFTKDSDDVESVDSDSTIRAGVPIYTPSASSRSPSISGGVILTPAESSDAENELGFPDDTIAYDRTRQVWPCPHQGCTRTFTKKGSLLAHINSPAHAPKLFHCPTGLKISGFKATKLFKTLSGLAQHIEAGACAGGKDGLRFIAALFEMSIKQVTGRQIKLLTV